MTPREHILKILTTIDLPKNKMTIGGSGVMALRNIRQIRDLDVFVRRALWNELEASGAWMRWDPDPNDSIRHADPPYLIKIVDGIECHLFYDWKHRGYRVDVQEAIDNSEWVEDWPCVSLNFILQWKEFTRRPKDVEDIKLINEYLVAGGV